jgi:hypothetical protein
MRKEWQEWLKWGSVKVHDLNTSRQLCRDPSVIPYIMGSRFCFRNKNAGIKVLDLFKLKKPLVHAKARLVLQAYRAPNKSRIRKDSPTASRNGFYVLVQIGISLDFIFVSGDATSAFMQGGADDAAERLFMRPPRNGRLEGVEPGQIIEVLGAVYGKGNAPRLWYRVIVGFLVSDGWKLMRIDVAMLARYEKGELVGVIILHVDDFFAVVRDQNVLARLRSEYTWGSWDVGNDHRWNGRHIVIEPGVKASITQEEFCNNIEINKPDRERRQEIKSPLTAKEMSEFASVVGSGQWVGGVSNPPIQAEMSLVQGANRTVEYLLKAQSILKEVRDNPDSGIVIIKVDLNEAVIVNFSDGSWSNADGHKTQSAYVLMCAEPSSVTSEVGGKGSVLDWRSHRLKRMVHCTLYAEAMSSRSDSTAAIWLRLLMLEVLHQDFHATDAVLSEDIPEEINRHLKVYTVTDCNSLHECVIKSSLPEDKRAAVEILAIREMLTQQLGEEDLSEDEFQGRHRYRLHDADLKKYFLWSDSKTMKADILTKRSTGIDRKRWIESQNVIILHSLKRSDVLAARPIPSKPRPKLDKVAAKQVIANWTEEQNNFSLNNNMK